MPSAEWLRLLLGAILVPIKYSAKEIGSCEMPIVISGHLATAIFNLAERKQASPQPATGKHAELLAEILQGANALIRLVELERSGVCDGAGIWVGSDPILNTAQKLVALAEQRVGEPRR